MKKRILAAYGTRSICCSSAATGVGGEIRNRKVAAVCNFLGRYSFPLYCTHYSFTILQRVWRDAHPNAPWQMHLATVCACAFFALINAYVAMKLADWFASKFRK